MVRSSAGNFYNYFSPGLGELIRSSEGRVAPPPSIFFSLPFSLHVSLPVAHLPSLPVPCSIVSPFQPPSNRSSRIPFARLTHTPIFSFSSSSSSFSTFQQQPSSLSIIHALSFRPNRNICIFETHLYCALSFRQLSFDTCWRKPTTTPSSNSHFCIGLLEQVSLGYHGNYSFRKLKSRAFVRNMQIESRCKERILELKRFDGIVIVPLDARRRWTLS